MQAGPRVLRDGAAVDYGLLSLLATIFGGAFVLNAIAVETLPPATIVAVRQALGAMVMIAVMLHAGQRMPAFGRAWLLILAAAVLGNALPFFLAVWAQEKVEAGLAAILTSSTPIMALVIGHFFTQDERFTRARIIGVVLGFSGVLVLFGLDNLASLGEDSMRQYALLAAAASFAVNAFVLKRLAGLPRLGTISAVLMLSCLVILPFSLAIDRPWTLAPSLGSLGAVAALGLVQAAFGNLLRFEIVGRRGALFLTQLSYLIPLSGLFWAFVVLGEVPEPRTWLALALILSGIWFARAAPLKSAEIGQVR